MTQGDLLRLFVLENRDAADRILGAMTNRDQHDRDRGFELINKLIEGEQLDLRDDESIGALDKLLSRVSNPSAPLPISFTPDAPEMLAEPPALTLEPEPAEAEVIDEGAGER